MGTISAPHWTQTMRPWKKCIPVPALAVGCVINTFFIVSTLFDYSADLFASEGPIDTSPQSLQRLQFVGQYYAWRTSQPVVTTLATCIIPILPFAIFRSIRNAVGTLLRWEQASTLRHVMDVAQCCILLLVILPLVINYKIPTQAALVTACNLDLSGASGGDVDALGDVMVCAVEAAKMRTVDFRLLMLNITMFICNVCKYAGNSPVTCNEVNAELKDKEQ